MMKKITLSAIVTSIISLGSASAVADLQNQAINNMHSISKRPYQKLPDESAYQSEEKWTGAAMMSGGTNSADNVNSQHLKFHFLGKRPFMEKTPSNYNATKF